jgi:hypothetical protein
VRFGYFLYPLGLIGWLALARESPDVPAPDVPAPDVASDPGG